MTIPIRATTINPISFTSLLERWPGAKAELIKYLIASNELPAYLEKEQHIGSSDHTTYHIPAIVTDRGGVISGSSTVVFNVIDVEFIEKHYPYVTSPPIISLLNRKQKDNENSATTPDDTTLKTHKNRSEAKKKYKKSDITLKIAALLCDVSVSTIQNWERGKRLPIGIPYPGRLNCIEFKKFSNTYQGAKRTKQQAMAIERAQSRDPQLMAEEEHEQTVWDS